MIRSSYEGATGLFRRAGFICGPVYIEIVLKF